MALEDHEETQALTQGGQGGQSRAGGGLVARDEPVDERWAALAAGPVREGSAQGGGLHLLGRPLAEHLARSWTVNDATADELRCAVEP